MDDSKSAASRARAQLLAARGLPSVNFAMTAFSDVGQIGSPQQAMVSMELLPSEADRAGAYDRESPNAVRGVRGIMAKDILPDQPVDRRRRSSLCALRAMDRLELLGEENMIATLVERPQLRWLADEEGARWAILTELGPIGALGAFEEAVEWVLENRPSPEEANTYICRFRACPRQPVGGGRPS